MKALRGKAAIYVCKFAIANRGKKCVVYSRSMNTTIDLIYQVCCLCRALNLYTELTNSKFKYKINDNVFVFAWHDGHSTGCSFDHCIIDEFDGIDEQELNKIMSRVRIKAV